MSWAVVLVVSLLLLLVVVSVGSGGTAGVWWLRVRGRALVRAWCGGTSS